MDFIDHLRVLANRIANTKDLIQTEEATKNAMVMPFIQILGYNVFDPLEVTPELIADVGTKKGEKVDYAILRDGKPIMLFECKKSGGDLSINHAGQLFRPIAVAHSATAIVRRLRQSSSLGAKRPLASDTGLHTELATARFKLCSSHEARFAPDKLSPTSSNESRGDKWIGTT